VFTLGTLLIPLNTLLSQRLIGYISDHSNIIQECFHLKSRETELIYFETNFSIKLSRSAKELLMPVLVVARSMCNGNTSRPASYQIGLVFFLVYG
jgi:hypothetical protein